MKESLQRSYHLKSDPSLREADLIFFENGKIIDFQKKEMHDHTLLIANGKIKQIGIPLPDSFSGEIIDLNGKLIIPGMLDMHVHFREPGREDKETLMSGAAAAMAGGFTGVCTMPNTEPATDNKEIVEYIQEKFRNRLVNVFPIATITQGRKGENLVEMAELVDAGVVAFSDDGTSVANAQVLRRALEYVRMFDIPIIEHCEDKNLDEGGAMNEGYVSTRLGLPGLPAIAEEIIVARDIMLAKYTSAKIHIAHISTAGSVELVRRAKNEGIHVTCEVTPHHFTLTDESLSTYDTNFKMNPPLRTQDDIYALIEGLKDGTIDAIATDHAPHTSEEKEVEFIAAPFGIIGLETAIGLVISQLVKQHGFSIIDVLAKLSVNPYAILGLPVPQIAKGELANLTILETDSEWIVDKNKFKSRSHNSPFHNWKLTGKSWGVLNNKLFKQGADS